MNVTRRALVALTLAGLVAGTIACSSETSSDDNATHQATTTVATSAVAATAAPKVQRLASWEAAYLTALTRYAGTSEAKLQSGNQICDALVNGSTFDQVASVMLKNNSWDTTRLYISKAAHELCPLENTTIPGPWGFGVQVTRWSGYAE
ncbi:MULTISPECIES: DUF732 domain-containing protein [unclassified Rhodococcus (in: high G+C Gram-positive bacteria)]|jgi:hypothetical protein|uniref:DUF732 domain-containing protein n=1 Tax=unclassified Rhodococcus (in: high G+C Gram-positive bacteria) TaxID=192944 RepID=UPI00037377C1|nr:DUF732 domain-containing protein [Rhodococcus sp. DK17]